MLEGAVRRAAIKCIKDTDVRFKESRDIFLLAKGLEHCSEILQAYAESNNKPIEWVNNHPIVSLYVDRLIIGSSIVSLKDQMAKATLIAEGSAI